MTDPIVVSDATLDELEASRTFEVFYQAEARTLFRRLWLVTGNRAEAELIQDASPQNIPPTDRPYRPTGLNSPPHSLTTHSPTVGPTDPSSPLAGRGGVSS